MLALAASTWVVVAQPFGGPPSGGFGGFGGPGMGRGGSGMGQRGGPGMMGRQGGPGMGSKVVSAAAALADLA